MAYCPPSESSRPRACARGGQHSRTTWRTPASPPKRASARSRPRRARTRTAARSQCPAAAGPLRRASKARGRCPSARRSPHRGRCRRCPPPQKGLTVLVTGGAGYIGSVLTGRLLERGYNVRVLDRLYWGETPLAAYSGRIELEVADVREIPPSALDGVDGVIHLAGLSNAPTAEYDTEANWQMNAVATEALGNACLERGIERIVFASSCSLYDGLPPGMHDESAAIAPRGAYATSKRYGEEALLGLIEQGLCPVILRNGTVYGHSTRMRYDLVVNTFVK